jgi:hypothetical protein
VREGETTMKVEYSSCVGLRPIPEGAPEWAKRKIIEARAFNTENRTSAADQQRRNAEKQALRKILDSQPVTPLPLVVKQTRAVVSTVAPSVADLKAKADRQAKEILNDFSRDGRIWEETVESAETVQRSHRVKNEWSALKKELGL